LWKSESEVDVDINVGIVLGRASVNWSIVVNDVLCNHASYSFVAAVAEVSSCIHNSFRATAALFKNDEVGWHVKLKITTTASIVSFNHDDNALIVAVSSS
jgi:hypothetical protein